MRLKYMFNGQKRNVYPFYVKSNWNLPIKKSVDLERYVEEVQLQLAGIDLKKKENGTQGVENIKGTQTTLK